MAANCKTGCLKLDLGALIQRLLLFGTWNHYIAVLYTGIQRDLCQRHERLDGRLGVADAGRPIDDDHDMYRQMLFDWTYCVDLLSSHVFRMQGLLSPSRTSRVSLIDLEICWGNECGAPLKTKKSERRGERCHDFGSLCPHYHISIPCRMPGESP